MKTVINNTVVTLEMTSFEEHTHDDLLVPIYGRPDLEPVKPFRVAYIHMITNLGEKYSGRVEEDKMTCLVNIEMIDGVSPKLVFDLVDVEPVADNVTTYAHSVNDLENTLDDLADAIRYHEI